MHRKLGIFLTLWALFLPAMAIEAPRGLAAAPVSCTAIGLSWAGTDPAGFVLERSLDNRLYVEVARPPAGSTTWTDSGLVADTLYLYRLRPASDPSRVSNWTWARTLLPVSAATAVNEAWAHWQSNGSIHLLWTDDFGDETAWRIRRSTDGNTWSTVADLPANTTAWVDPGPHAADTYFTYRIVARKNSVESAVFSVTAAFDSTSTSNVVTQWSDALPVPTGFNFSSDHSRSILLTWNAVGEATGYRIQRSWDGKHWQPIGWINDATTTTYTYIGAIPGYDHHFRIQALGTVDGVTVHSFVSAPVIARSQGFDPAIAAPSDLTATLNEDVTLTLSWVDNSNNETGFVVEEDRYPATTVLATLPANTTTWTLAEAPFGFRSYRVQALGPSSASAYSNTVTVFRKYSSGSPPPSPPTGLSATVRSATRIDLAWNADTNPVPLTTIERSDDAGATWRSIGLNLTYDTSTNWRRTRASFEDYLCSPGTTYRYRLSLQGHPEIRSNVVIATTTANTAAPAAPSGLTATGVARGQINLVWTDAANNETGYRVERSSNGGSTFATVAELPVNSTRFSDTGLSASTTRHYRILALGAAGNGVSATVSATTLSTNPPVTVTLRNRVSFQELVINGSPANDHITVSASGSDHIVTVNGSALAPISQTIGTIVVRGNEGDDTITIDPSVQVRVLVYGGNGNNHIVARGQGRQHIITLGGGRDRVWGNGRDTNYWVDQAGIDEVYASAGEVAAGRVHQVERFVQPFATDPAHSRYLSKNLTGGNWPGGFLYHSADTVLSNNALWGERPSMFDVNQGFHQNCPSTSASQTLANHHGDRLEDLMVDLGDGTYAVHVGVDPADLYVRVDGRVNPELLAQPGPSGNLWWLILEKTWSWGLTLPWAAWPESVETMVLCDDPEVELPRLQEALAMGDNLLISTSWSNHNNILGLRHIASSHAHSVEQVYRNTAGEWRIVVRNPYGLHYMYNWGPRDPHQGLMDLSYDQFRYIFKNVGRTRWHFAVPQAVLAGPNQLGGRRIEIETSPDTGLIPLLDGLAPETWQGPTAIFPEVDPSLPHIITWPPFPESNS